MQVPDEAGPSKICGDGELYFSDFATPLKEFKEILYPSHLQAFAIYAKDL